MSNGTNGNGGPPWMRFIASVGVPSALAIGLVWWMTQIQHQAILDAQAAIATHSADTERQIDQLLDVSRQICTLLAETDDERRGCFSRSPYTR